MSEGQIGLESVVTATTDVFSTSIGSDLLIFDQKEGSYFGSSEVGARVWELIAEETSVSSICDKLCDEFEVDRSVCETEVQNFLSELHKKELVKIV